MSLSQKQDLNYQDRSLKSATSSDFLRHDILFRLNFTNTMWNLASEKLGIFIIPQMISHIPNY